MEYPFKLAVRRYPKSTGLRAVSESSDLRGWSIFITHKDTGEEIEVGQIFYSDTLRGWAYTVYSTNILKMKHFNSASAGKVWKDVSKARKKALDTIRSHYKDYKGAGLSKADKVFGILKDHSESL